MLRDWASRVVLSEAVDWCICFTRKIQHGGDWERSGSQGPKNVHNFWMTVRPLSWACGHGTGMLLIPKKIFRLDYSPIHSDMTGQRNVPLFCTRSICGWNLFQRLGQGLSCPRPLYLSDDLREKYRTLLINPLMLQWNILNLHSIKMAFSLKIRTYNNNIFNI